MYMYILICKVANSVNASNSQPCYVSVDKSIYIIFSASNFFFLSLYSSFCILVYC